jgi:hypothetical protein
VSDGHVIALAILASLAVFYALVALAPEAPPSGDWRMFYAMASAAFCAICVLVVGL